MADRNERDEFGGIARLAGASGQMHFNARPSETPMPGHWRAASGLVRHVVAQGAHPPAEDLEAAVDGRLGDAAQARLAHHLRWCRRCSDELADLHACARALRQPLPERGAPAGAWVRLWARFQPLGGFAPAGAAAVAAVAGLTVAGVWQRAPVADGAARMAPAPQPSDALDERAFDELERISPQARIAWQQGDAPALAALLQPQADAGDALAADALGVLYARGRGVPRDEARAAHYWRLAAAAGRASALRNLQALGR